MIFVSFNMLNDQKQVEHGWLKLPTCKQKVSKLPPTGWKLTLICSRFLTSKKKREKNIEKHLIDPK